ncbi:hypothetical protein K7X08_003547 [Anisodus acutangulus]|uniref:Glycoside hydrolase family 3 N-terminal domain-containing protein n=1 Tax=Anisodus acutangulus TaxID=402998 RepID=A0A9Q1MH59_9SOLA|nr:hypothetical protein K7X08_003547 [Anisodus acutangulus]
MTQIERAVANPSAIRDRCIGSVLSGGGSRPFENAESADWANMIDGFQKGTVESRLGIPIFYGTDAIHGNNNVWGATIFPHNIGLGATRDANLVRRIGEVTALETRACGSPYPFAPCVAVAKDPRWGRFYESYSEDTEVVRKMTSLVSGLQGQPPEGHPYGYPYVAGRNYGMASAKHFVGDGATEKGINGLLITDWEALERLTDPHDSDYRQSVKSTINAGIDMELLSLVESGEIAMTRIDDDVERILRIKFVAGLFEHPFTDRFGWLQGILISFCGCSLYGILCIKVAREAVRKSLVLLKNGKDPKKPFLPLDKTAKKILVAGTHADDLGHQCGGWTATWTGLSGRITVGTTILDALRELLGDKTEIVFEPNPTAETFASHDFSFAVVAIGEGP